ncbi:MAG: PAS domain S-box protein, partial [Bacteroidetes bacterium]|nr:PAS domain S-box protein [Bacteroidota bacterium]
MNSGRFLLVIAFCVLITQSLFSQRYFVKSYTIEDGLPTRIVYDVCQDTIGHMWFATHNGISSYDGYCFTNYDAADGLPRQHYRRVICDEKGVIWGIPESIHDTIVKYQNKIWSRVISASQRHNVETTSFDMIYKDGNPVLCVGTTAGLDIFQNNRWNHLNVSNDPRKNKIIYVTSNNGKFYALSKAGGYLAEQTKTGWCLGEFLKPQGETIIALKFERPGTPAERIWMLSASQITYLQYGKLNLYADGFTLPEPDISNSAFFNIDSRGNFYFGNNWAKYFVTRIHGKTMPLMVNNGFSSNGASSVFIDKEQNIWFSDTRGVDKINNFILVNYYEINGLLENEVTAVVELKSGGLVFGHNNGLSVFDHGTFKRIHFPGLNSNLSRVLDIMQDNQGNVWFAASNHGFGRLKDNGTLVWYPPDDASLATTILQDKGGRIWMGTSQKLYYLKNDKLIPFDHNDKISSPFRKIFRTPTGEIVGAGLYGLYFFSVDKVKNIPIADEVKTQSIYSYYQTSSGVEFVGTLNGLCIVENGRVEKFNKNGISIDSPIYFIFQDGDLNFWLGSNNGVIKWDGKNKLETFNIQNGLAGRETNRSAGLVDSQGNVWIGMDLGLSCFQRGFSELKPPIPSLRLLNIQDSKGTAHPFDQNCTIKFDNNTLTFNFRGISFVNEDLISYRYQLKGIDGDWQLLKQSNLDKVKYTNIPTGHYQFLVQVRNGTGGWSELVKSGTITVQPSLYQRWWFNLIIALLVCVIIYGIIKIVVQWRYNLKLENEILLRKNSEHKTLLTLQALNESEQKYRNLIEFAVDGILIGSKEGIITVANSYMQNLTGRNPENLIGIHITNLFSEAQINQVPLRFDLLERGELVVNRREVQRADGTTVLVEMHTKMMPDGSYQSIFHDITSRKQEEEKLKKSKELYKLITDKMSDVVWLMDLKGKSIFVCQSIEQFTGFNVEEYLKQTFDDRFTPQSASIGKLLFGSEIARLTDDPESLKGFTVTQQMEYICKNGGTKWGELLITPYLGLNNEWLG